MAWRNSWCDNTGLERWWERIPGGSEELVEHSNDFRVLMVSLVSYRYFG